MFKSFPLQDDLEVSPDFFEYFLGTHNLLMKDSSLWCISAWNDNGKEALIDSAHPELLYRTDFFPGLGWMLTRTLWSELSVKWPKSSVSFCGIVVVFWLSGLSSTISSLQVLG